jgi:hypothetical protein
MKQRLPDEELGNGYRTLAPHPVADSDAQAWVSKASARSAPLVALAGSVGDPSPVAPRAVAVPEDWPFGRFMTAWLDRAPAVRLVRHLPDCSFFLRLLDRVYEPVLTAQPDFATLLRDESRPEMSLTNDVLQIQLHDLGPRYSMVRHHSLMLFLAATWLDDPQRSAWLALYDALVTYVDTRPQGRPGLTELEDVEAGAFDDFVTLAPRTIETADAVALLSSRHGELDRIVDYQLYAAVAIGLQWRDYRTLDVDDRQQWLEDQLSAGYLRPDYLEEQLANRR